jgi:hypothetical protein
MEEDHPESALVNLLKEQLDDVLQQLKAKEEECNELIELIIQKDALIEDHKRILKSAAKQVPGIEY